MARAACSSPSVSAARSVPGPARRAAAPGRSAPKRTGPWRRRRPRRRRPASGRAGSSSRARIRESQPAGERHGEEDDGEEDPVAPAEERIAEGQQREQRRRHPFRRRGPGGPLEPAAAQDGIDRLRLDQRAKFLGGERRRGDIRRAFGGEADEHRLAGEHVRPEALALPSTSAAETILSGGKAPKCSRMRPCRSIGTARSPSRTFEAVDVERFGAKRIACDLQRRSPAAACRRRASPAARRGRRRRCRACR